ncbi:MAG: heme o synthase [Candidatus Dormibacteria bacterium]
MSTRGLLLPARMRARLRDYAALMKLRLTTLLLVTTLAAMFVAAHGHPSLRVVLITLLAGTLSSGCCATFNEVIERDRDRMMARTCDRPIPSGRVSVPEALGFGLIQGIASCGMMLAWVNLLSAELMLGAILYYVVVYTMWLKPSTTQGVVIGGAAGALPPLVGWAAVTGSLNLTALGLFALIFFWTPPHFWALSLLIKDDYARAEYPMLPVVIGERETRVSILLHSAVLISVSLMLFGFRAFGALYLVAALVLGAVWMLLALRLWWRPGRPAASLLFRYSLLYLALIFLAMAVDQAIS